ncbi:MAG: helix-turn-helix domain-containing protein [Rubrivivax sp.]|nr:helix-turn-helix domain-containing protein [Rubrivivax sp.]
MNDALARLLPLLVHVQAQLDGDLSAAALARHAGLSVSRLHRLFVAATGETPKAYVTRLRLERAAFRLHLHEATLLELALDSGYRHHETFTRAFVRHHGVPPGAYRSAARRRRGDQAQRAPVPRHPAGLAPLAYELSASRVQRLRAQHLAFVRHVGPYEEVPGSLFDELLDWAQGCRLPGPWIWLGIGHDAPSTTAADRLRFDAAVVVPRPFAPSGRVACQLLPEGLYAVVTHVGPFGTLPQAYAQAYVQALALPGHRLVGLPAVEIYRAARVDIRHRLNQTDICLPVQRAAG